MLQISSETTLFEFFWRHAAAQVLASWMPIVDDPIDFHFELTECLLTRGGAGLPVLLPAHLELVKQMVCLLRSDQSRSFPITQHPKYGFVAVLSEMEEVGRMMSPDGV